MDTRRIQEVAIFAPDSRPYGMTYTDWIIKWWNWLFSIPRDENPASDKTGNYCAKNQSGPVWFLAGTWEEMSEAERKCEVQAGNAVMLPVIASEKSFAEFPDMKTEEELKLRAKEAIDRVRTVGATLDGVRIPDIDKYRFASGAFDLTVVANNSLGLPSGVHRVASEGYFIILEPLPAGIHEIEFGGEAFCMKDRLEFKTQLKYRILVRGSK